MDRPPPLLAQFGDFMLDEGNARLVRNGQAVELAPKAFSVLCVLVRQPGQLVVKDALLDAVWGHQHVSESVLKTLISQLRAALLDDAKHPRFIETASRRGYRFIAPLAASGGLEDASPPAEDASGEPALIGRAGGLAMLAGCLRSALAGKLQVVLVAGEPGIGKTTLIDRFVAVHAVQGVRAASGQCVEHYGGSEPYLPVLEALNLVCRSDVETLLPLMRQVAPTWLAQLPWYLTDEDRQQLQREVAGSTQDRMLREMGELLDRYTADHPLLLVLEDLHWSDHPTVQLIGYLARRRSRARLMLLGSFRPADIIASDHPLKEQRQELRLHGLCQELDLEAFSETEVRDFLAVRLPGLDCPETTVRALHRHTEGLPLFVSSVVEELIAEGVVAEGPEGWKVTAEPRQVIPANIAGLIEKQINRLPEEQQRWLAAASVAGVEFLHAPLADVLGIDAGELQDGLDTLVRRHQWLRSSGATTLPDGRLSARYAFRHALYRHVFYRTSSRAQRIRMHRSVAEALQRAHGPAAAGIASELAMHFERGAELSQAVAYLRLAAARALGRSAVREAAQAAQHALRLLEKLPESIEKLEAELDLRVMEGAALTHLISYAAPEVATAFERAQVLCELLPDNPARARAMHGMWWVNFARADLARAGALAARIEAMSAGTNDDALELAGHCAMGLTLAHTGDFDGALRHLEAGSRVYGRIGATLPPGLFLQDPGVELMSYMAVLCWWKGYTARARTAVAAALALAEKLRHPLSQAVALHFSGVIHFLAREPEPAKLAIERIFRLVQEHGIWQGPGGHSWVHGWAVALLGDVPAGRSEMRNGKDNCLRMGMVAGLTGNYVCHAEACLAAGLADDALAEADAGLAFAQAHGDVCFLSPLLRLRGQALLRQGDRDGAQQALAAALARASEQRADHFAIEALIQLAGMNGIDAAAALQQLRALLAMHPDDDSPAISAARGLVAAATRNP